MFSYEAPAPVKPLYISYLLDIIGSTAYIESILSNTYTLYEGLAGAICSYYNNMEKNLYYHKCANATPLITPASALFFA